MTWRDWILPGALIALSAGLFGVSFLIWRAARVQEILEQERGA